MPYKVGAKGQVVIPRELQDELGIEVGDEVTFWRDGDHVALRPVRRSSPLKGRYPDGGLVRGLEAERAAERVRERA